MYKKYLSNAKVCGLDTNGCFSGTYKRMDGTTATYESNKYTLVMADGAEISMWDANFSSNCSLSSSGTTKSCQQIMVDVNGAKNPNTLGQDTFSFTLKENGLVPTGCDYANCNDGSVGWGCTCKVIREGAINY